MLQIKIKILGVIKKTIKDIFAMENSIVCTHTVSSSFKKVEKNGNFLPLHKQGNISFSNFSPRHI